jgi:hypothetical protein
MGQVTLAPAADATGWSSPAYGAGVGNHLPVGDYGGANYRSGIRFAVPSGWANWTGITKATLNIYTSDFDHVGPRNSSIYVRRQTVAGLWTKGEGSQSCESGFSSGNTTQFTDLVGVTTGQVSFSSGTSASSKKSIVVTGLVEYYRAQGAAAIVLILDNVGSGDYSEFWSRHKSGYDISLVLDYEDDTVPDAPTLGTPTAGSTVTSQYPTFTWTHNDPQGDPQTSAEIRVWQSGVQQGATQVVSGSANYIGWPNALTRGGYYQWDVRTRDALGWGPWTGQRSFTVKALPVVTIENVRYMEFNNGAPRLRVKWSVSGGTQKKYRVQATGFDTGWLTSTNPSHLLHTLALTNGTAVSITVSVETTDVLQGSASRSFTPRWGLTTHRHNLGAVPTGWGSPTLVQVVPSGASLVVEYGSNTSAAGAPTAWYSALSSVPKAQYLYWRAWFIPSATAGPTLDRIAIPASFVAESVDHWFLLGGAAIAPPSKWSIDTGEYVYGTRSMTKEGDGVLSAVFSKRIPVRTGRSYILTGLMRSTGNSGARFTLADADSGLVMTMPGANEGDPDILIQSDLMDATKEWYEPDALDVYRYKTPIWVAPTDMEVVVRLHASGPVGTQSWWDGLKLEESTVATPWGPNAIGAVSLDAGGVQVDGTKGGVFRLRGSAGGVRDVIELAGNGLIFGNNVNLYNSAQDILRTFGFFESAGLIVPLSGSGSPTISGLGTGVMSGNNTAWVKVGRLVVFRLNFVISTGGSGATQVALANLGMPSSSFAARIQGERNSTDPLIARLSPSGAVMQVERIVTEAAPTVALTGAGMTTGTYSFHGSYLADA